MKTIELNLATNTPVNISATEYDPGEANFYLSVYDFKKWTHKIEENFNCRLEKTATNKWFGVIGA